MNFRTVTLLLALVAIAVSGCSSSAPDHQNRRGSASAKASTTNTLENALVEQKVAEFTSRLKLTPAQTAALREIVSRQTAVLWETLNKITNGAAQEDIARAKQQLQQDDQQIKALLTPDQNTAYLSLKREKQRGRAIELAASRLKDLALYDLPGITSEQHNQILNGLTDIAYVRLGEMETNDVGPVIPPDQESNLVHRVLSPEQFGRYQDRQSKPSPSFWTQILRIAAGVNPPTVH